MRFCLGKWPAEHLLKYRSTDAFAIARCAGRTPMPCPDVIPDCPPLMTFGTAPLKLLIDVDIFCGEAYTAKLARCFLHVRKRESLIASAFLAPGSCPNTVAWCFPFMPFGAPPAMLGASTQVLLRKQRPAILGCKVLEFVQSFLG
jgi:hypothetical protein